MKVKVIAGQCQQLFCRFSLGVRQEISDIWLMIWITKMPKIILPVLTWCEATDCKYCKMKVKVIAR